MITFYNCGQGDCALIDDIFRLPSGIEHVKLYVDLGPNSFNVPNPIPDADLLLSHSHDDHCLGAASNLNPRRIFVPDHFIEMQTIVSSLNSQKNLSPAAYSNLRGKFIPVNEANPLMYSANLQWDVFNPMDCYWSGWSNRVDYNAADRSILDNFLADNGSEFRVDDLIEIVRGALPYYVENFQSDYDLVSFVFTCLYRIYNYAQNGHTTLQRALYQFQHHDVNGSSIVFKYTDSNDVTFLFTGDAPSKVFMRKYALKDLQSQVLKVPHHGSSTGFDLRNIKKGFSKVLNKIQPVVMIVSHRSRGSRPPHKDIIDYLAQNGTLILTNNLPSSQAPYLVGPIHSPIHGIQLEVV